MAIYSDIKIHDDEITFSGNFQEDVAFSPRPFTTRLDSFLIYRASQQGVDFGVSQSEIENPPADARNEMLQKALNHLFSGEAN